LLSADFLPVMSHPAQVTDRKTPPVNAQIHGERCRQPV
jgi:hypothetical protein